MGTKGTWNIQHMLSASQHPSIPGNFFFLLFWWQWGSREHWISDTNVVWWGGNYALACHRLSVIFLSIGHIFYWQPRPLLSCVSRATSGNIFKYLLPCLKCLEEISPQRYELVSTMLTLLCFILNYIALNRNDQTCFWRRKWMGFNPTAAQT